MELARFPSHGRFSVRSIITFVLTALITVLLSTILASTPAHAADANWKGAMLQYDGRDHYLAGTTDADNPMPSIPANSMYYTSVETPTGATATTLQKAHVIYLSPGLSPPGDGKATYLTYNYDSRSKTFSSPSAATAITVDVASINDNPTTCAIEGIGWFVCPVMNFLAQGMDWVFDAISSFMDVQPLQTGNNQGALYNAWNVMRSIANVAFIIFFIIIIYSQLTSVQVNNYGIKRLLPRLIIAAVAINISYIICAIAIDASNILGHSIHTMLIELRDNLLSTGVMSGANQAALWNWESLVAFALSGGTAAVAGYIGIVSIAGSVSAAAFLLLPALVGLLMAILVVLLILAARQALIVILVIVAPLALVAYLLPNTEKWFDKWRGLFFTLLVFFPAFSVVFGGSQLAGAVIIQNANNLNMLILGMIVQVAPLVITPLLLKFSGGLIGSIARLVNNPNKGAIDRTRNYAKSQADMRIAQRKANLDRRGNPLLDKNGKLRNSRNPIRKHARYLDQRKRLRSDLTSNAETAAQFNYENSKSYSNKRRDLSEQKANLENYKEATHSKHAAHVDTARQTKGSLVYQSSIDAMAAKEKAESASNSTTAFYNRIRTDSNLATRMGAGALHTSSYNLETSKANLESTDTLKAAYYNAQRTASGTPLNLTARTLETSKLKAETAQNNYTAMVETMKAAPTAQISVAARQAQSSKEHLEVAQNQLQAFFDTERGTKGTVLYDSTNALESSKSIAEEAKSNLTAVISKERSDKTGSLRGVTVRAEQAKISQQIAEERLSSFVEELKSGKIEAADLASPAEQVVMQQMQADTIRLAAEKRRGDSARYEIQRTIADVMTGADKTDPVQVALTEEMLTIAQGVGGDTARVRAISNAVATARGLDNDGLKANVDLLKDEAQRNGTNIKHYSNEIVRTVLNGETVTPRGVALTPERIKAALQAQAEEKNIPIFEEVVASEYFDHAMVREIVSLNSPAFKGAGAFAMQDRLRTLADYVDDFSDENKVAKGKKEFGRQISLDHISNLASANADGISGWKMGQVVEMSKPDVLKADLLATREVLMAGSKPDATPEEIRAADEARANLGTAFSTVREALENDDIRAGLKDREMFVRRIEKALALAHGVEPLPDATPKVSNNLENIDSVFSELNFDTSNDPEVTENDDEEQA